ALSSRGRRTLDRFPFLGFSFVFSLWTPSSSLTPHRSLELPPIPFSSPIRSRAARPFRFWPSGEVHRENRRFPGRTLTANGGVFPRLSSATRVLSRRTRRTEQQTERERVSCVWRAKLTRGLFFPCFLSARLHTTQAAIQILRRFAFKS
ncbi:hypothetical protein TGRUB_221518, partial [Toxoplasma gondii RUB]